MDRDVQRGGHPGRVPNPPEALQPDGQTGNHGHPGWSLSVPERSQGARSVPDPPRGSEPNSRSGERVESHTAILCLRHAAWTHLVPGCVGAGAVPQGPRQDFRLGGGGACGLLLGSGAGCQGKRPSQEVSAASLAISGFREHGSKHPRGGKGMGGRENGRPPPSAGARGSQRPPTYRACGMAHPEAPLLARLCPAGIIRPLHSRTGPRLPRREVPLDARYHPNPVRPKTRAH